MTTLLSDGSCRKEMMRSSFVVALLLVFVGVVFLLVRAVLLLLVGAVQSILVTTGVSNAIMDCLSLMLDNADTAQSHSERDRRSPTDMLLSPAEQKKKLPVMKALGSIISGLRS